LGAVRHAHRSPAAQRRPHAASALRPVRCALSDTPTGRLPNAARRLPHAKKGHHLRDSPSGYGIYCVYSYFDSGNQ